MVYDIVTHQYETFKGELEIPAGEHVYPFSTMLPPQLPSSFDGEHGHVHYTVKATLDRPWKFDQDTKLVFNVVTPVDLNFNVRAKVILILFKI